MITTSVDFLAILARLWLGGQPVKLRLKASNSTACYITLLTYRLESNPLLTLHQQGICWNHSRRSQEITQRRNISLSSKRKHM